MLDGAEVSVLRWRAAVVEVYDLGFPCLPPESSIGAHPSPRHSQFSLP